MTKDDIHMVSKFMSDGISADILQMVMADHEKRISAYPRFSADHMHLSTFEIIYDPLIQEGKIVSTFSPNQSTDGRMF